MIKLWIISLSWLTMVELDSLRIQYLAAAEDSSKLDVLEKSCSSLSNNSITSQGYCVMIHFLEAKNAFNPYRKLSEFNIGKRKLDSLILADEKNIELRYMRHSIQDRVPSFLGYHDQLQVDKNFMIANLDSIKDLETYKLIYDYLDTIKE